MESFSASMGELTIGSMADFWRATVTGWSMAYWNNSPTAPAAAMALTPLSANPKNSIGLPAAMSVAAAAVERAAAPGWGIGLERAISARFGAVFASCSASPP